ncbi:MAG: hypothetical protein LBB84_01040 [Tannerellaceae bacterium]|jgi:hypothetical protein|nr:hypothetical protein [Tannerellaceae bacterium]
MKKDGFPIAGYPLILCFLLWSCGVKKQQRSRYRETERIETLRTDSLQAQNLAREWLTRKVEVQHIEFMAPDSFSQPFVRSVTRIRAEEESRKEASSSLSAGKEERSRKETEAEAWRMVQSEGKSPWRLWWIVAAAGCGVVALRWMRRAYQRR